MSETAYDEAGAIASQTGAILHDDVNYGFSYNSLPYGFLYRGNPTTRTTPAGTARFSYLSTGVVSGSTNEQGVTV